MNNKITLKNHIIKKLFNNIYINKLLLSSYKLYSDEFDTTNDKISLFYNRLIHISGLSIIQIDRIINKIS